MPYLTKVLVYLNPVRLEVFGFGKLTHIALVENGQLYFNSISQNLSLNLPSLGDYFSNCILAIHCLKNGSCNSNLEVRVTCKFRMLSMNWDDFDGLQKKFCDA